MDGRTPEVMDTTSGENFKLACMACIRGHRTKHCGGHNCRDKILWTVKRPGRPSNSCMCKFSGTGRCKCVLAKAQCPHKPKKGEKKTVDCRCDERGRLCCTLAGPEWGMLAKGERPAVKLYRNLEELHAGFSNRNGAAFLGYTNAPPPGQSPLSTPQTPAASVGGLTNGSGGSTPQTPTTALRNPAFADQVPSLPQSPGVNSSTRFGMMGLGAPMGSEGQAGQDVLAWQGHTPIAPAPRPAFSTSPAYTQPSVQIQPTFPAPPNNSFAVPPYTFGDPSSQPPVFSPHQPAAHLHSHPATPQYQPQIHQQPAQNTFDGVPPVTTSFSDLSVAPAGTLPALTGFDMDYFNFQLPGAICQQCGMADCTCRACPTVLQSTMDGSWRQCCSRKHVHFGPATADSQASKPMKKSCCGSDREASAPLQTETGQQLAPTARGMVMLANATETRGSGGCCAGSSLQGDFDVDAFFFSPQHPHSNPNDPFALAAPPPHIPAFTTPIPDPGAIFDPGAPLPHTQSQEPELESFTRTADPNPELDFKQDPVPEWTDPGDIDMDFDEFIQEMGCGCGTECPCGVDVDEGAEMEIDGDPGGGETGLTPEKSCCGG